MIFGYSALGLAEITSTAKPQFKSVSYDKLEMYGNSYFQKLWGRNINVPTGELEDLTLETYDPEWDIDTFLLGKFNGNLSSGTVEFITSNLTHWLIYRKDNDKPVLTFVDKIPVDQISYVDYLVTKNNEYTYYIFGANDDEIAAPLIAEETVCDYWGFYLIDVEKNKSYGFKLNLEVGQFNYEENISEYQNNTAYSVVNRGNHKALSGTVQAIIWDSNSLITIEQGNQILKEFREFIFSGRKAYLKDNRGRMWQVFLSAPSESLLSPSIKEQIITCSFSFKQIGDEYNGG